MTSRRIIPNLLIIGSLLAFPGCERSRSTFSGSDTNSASTRSSAANTLLAFGNPSNATSDSSNKDNYLLVGDGSTFSYNNSRGTVNWISWLTTKDDLGDSIPRPDFRPDPRLPNGFKRIVHWDYSGSGYDRGHMVPSADRFSNPKLNEETFMMTNIVPQTGALNQYPWHELEKYARSLARRGFDVYQIAGVYGEQRRLKGKVTAPTNCWKIVMLIPRGRSTATIDARTRMIAVDMPNIDGLENVSWEKYRTSIRTIEERTGYDFLHFLPRELQDQIETKVEMRSR